METPIKILVIGATVSGLIALSGFSYERHLDSKVSALEAKCIEEGKSEKTLAAGFSGILLCNAAELHRLDNGESKGIQAEIVAAQREVIYSNDWYYGLAAGLLLLSATPYAWYFLLRRIRELRNAIVGD